MLVFRFANSLYEQSGTATSHRPRADHRRRDGRRWPPGEFYDRVGVVRDMMQNHVLQLLTFVALEPPSSFDAEALRNEKAKVLKRHPADREKDAAGCTVRGHLPRHPGVAPGSTTPTFAAIRYIDNWRWQGVPFYMRSQRRWQPNRQRSTSCSSDAARHVPDAAGALLLPNRLHLHPARRGRPPFVPGQGAPAQRPRCALWICLSVRVVRRDGHPEAYERLLLDVIKGRVAVHARSDAIELSWADRPDSGRLAESTPHRSASTSRARGGR
jgi:glucose-6-phosphate 1-dehydrogenase